MKTTRLALVPLIFLLSLFSFSQSDLCDDTPDYVDITIDGSISDFPSSIGSDNNATYYFSSDDSFFYIGIDGINLNNDNLHIAFRVPDDGTTNTSVAGMNFPAGLEWTYRIDFYAGNDICYFPFSSPNTCQQQGNNWLNYAGFDGNAVSEIRIPRAFLGSLSSGNGNAQMVIWANNNFGSFIFDTFPNSNPKGNSNQTLSSYGSVEFPTFEDFIDNDGDGYSVDCDCDDTNPAINPGVQEICDDNIDNDCDGTVDIPDLADFSNVQFPTSGDICLSESFEVFGWVFVAGLTDTTVGTAAPGIIADFGVNTTTLNPDLWPEENWNTATFNVENGDPNFGNTNSNDEYKYTFTPEAAGTYYYAFRYSLDNGCSYTYGGVGGEWNGDTNLLGVLVVNEQPTWYADADGDGFGNTNQSQQSCTQPQGYVDNPEDCDDANAAINPNAEDICDGIDNDCDGDIDEDTELVGFANIQAIDSAELCLNGTTNIFGQVYKEGLTDSNASVAPGITVDFGVFDTDSDPANWPESAWESAMPNPNYEFSRSNDEYMYTYTADTFGTFYYAFRYSLDDGCSYQYGATNNGFWNGNDKTNGVITVQDNENPVISNCPSDLTESAASANGAVVTWVTPIATDNCEATLVQTEGPASGSEFPIGNTTVSYTATDAAGNQATCSFTVTVEGVSPEIECPSNITVNNDAGECGAVVSFTATDAVGIPNASITYSPDSGTFFPVGTTMVTATATNAVGSTSCTFEVTVTDSELPIISTNGDVVVDADPDACTATVVVSASATDNCSVGNPVGTRDDGLALTDAYPLGVTTISWMVTDANANAAVKQTQTVTVNDTQLPNAIAQDVTVFLDANGQGILTAAEVDNGSADNCEVASISIDKTDFDCNDVGSNEENQPSVWINEIHYDNDGGDIGEFVEVAGTAGENLTGYSIVLYNGNGGGEYDREGLSGVISDQSNGFGAVSFNISGIQNGAPDGLALVNPQGELIEFLSYEGSFTASNGPASGQTSVDIGVEEPGSSPVGFSLQKVGVGNKSTDFSWTSASDDSPNLPNVGQEFVVSGGSGTSVTLTVTDTSGNTATATANVTVVDAGAPTAIANDITVQLDDTGNYTLSEADIEAIAAGSSDTCGNLSFEVSPNTFSCADLGAPVQVTLTASDTSGNSSTATATITVQDTAAPVALAIDSPLTIQLDANGEASITAEQIDNGSFDVCSEVSLGLSQENFDCSNLAVVNDLEPSVWINEIHYDDPIEDEGEFIEIAGTAGIDLSDYQLLAYDEDGELDDAKDLVGVIPDNGSGFGAIAFDLEDLSSQFFENGPMEGRALVKGGILIEFISYEGTVTALDGPIMGETSVDIGVSESNSTEVGKSLQRTGAGNTAQDFTWEGPADESPGVLNANQNLIGALTGVEVTLTVTDSSGNQATATAEVIVLDSIAPVIVSEGDQFINADNDACAATINLTTTATDNCGGVVLEGTRDDGLALTEAYPLGVTTVTWTATDTNGNEATPVTQIITVEDVSVTEVLCNNISVTLDTNGLATITAQDVDGGSNDSCGIASMEVYPNTFSCNDIGDNTVLLTVTDVNGNQDFCEAIVTVEGDLPIVDIVASQTDESCESGIMLSATGDPNWIYQWNTGATTQNILVQANGTYTVTATSASNCSTSVSFDVTDYSADNFASNYTILAANTVVLTNNTVQSGGVGATAHNGTISLKRKTMVTDFAKAAKVTVDGSSSATSVVQAAATVQMPQFYENTQSTSSSPDAIVNFFQTQVLDGEVYDRVEVRWGATAIFTQPNVYVRELVTFKDSKVEFQQCTNLYVKKRMRLGINTKFNSQEHPVSVYADANVSILASAKVVANIHANDNSISVVGTTWFNAAPNEMKGQFVAKSVFGLNNVIWMQNEQCASCDTETTTARVMEDVALEDSLEAPEMKLEAYPNPSNGDFNLSILTNDRTTEAQVRVYDLMGNQVYEGQFNPKTKFRFGSRLDSGVYVVKVTQGKQTQIIKLTRM